MKQSFACGSLGVEPRRPGDSPCSPRVVDPGANALKTALLFTLSLTTAISCAGASQATRAPAPGPSEVSANASADTLRVARLGDYVDRLEAFGFSGQILVAEHGRVVLERASGWADRRFRVPMTLDTRLATGSVTKNFVAAALMRLESQHRLKLSDRLGDRLPGVPADKAGLRLEQLLTHTAGLAQDIPDGLDHATRDELVTAVLAEPLSFAPGSRFYYSNAAYDLLAAVVERTAGENFDAWLRRDLLQPAGLGASGIAGAPGWPGLPAAIGYNEWKEVSVWRDWPRGWSGTGSGRMISTAREMWRWCEGLRSGRTLGSGGWERMSARHTLDADSAGYGLGLWISDLPGGRTLKVLGGDVDGYRAECRIYPEDDRVIVVLTNQDHFGLGVQRQSIANTLSRLALGADPLLPPAAAPLADTRDVEGAWILGGGGRIEIWREDGNLRLGARGQDAVDLFEPDDPEIVAGRHAILAKSDSVIRGAILLDTTMVHRALPPAEYDFAYPFLREYLRGLRFLYDRVTSATGLGVVSLPWSPRTYRSYLRLRLVDRSEDLFLGWSEGRLDDVIFGEGRPFPVLLPVAPLAGGGYASFDVIRSRSVPFRVLRAPDGRPQLWVTRGTGQVEAERVR